MLNKKELITGILIVRDMMIKIMAFDFSKLIKVLKNTGICNEEIDSMLELTKLFDEFQSKIGEFNDKLKEKERKKAEEN